jgi:hypothetical protein
MRPNGIAADRLVSWRAALSSAEPFLDVSNGARRLVIDWEDRPWIVILREDGSAVVTTYPSDERTVTAGSSPGPTRWSVNLSQQLTVQLKGMERLVDTETGAILFRHPTLLCLEIQDPSGMARLLAEPVKAQLPLGV